MFKKQVLPKFTSPVTPKRSELDESIGILRKEGADVNATPYMPVSVYGFNCLLNDCVVDEALELVPLVGAKQQEDPDPHGTPPLVKSLVFDWQVPILINGKMANERFQKSQLQSINDVRVIIYPSFVQRNQNHQTNASTHG